MMKIRYANGDDSLAKVFVAELGDGSKIEFVESVQPPFTREEKWVFIVSTLKGCPVHCPICDAGSEYHGKLTVDEIVEQVEYLVRRRYPDGRVPVPKLKVQFARMGDPAFNPAVLDAIRELPKRLELPGLMPSISTVAPVGCDRFFDELLRLKATHYANAPFQMQFSVHTTDWEARRQLVPIRTWSLAQMAAYGDRFFTPGSRKITLNFAAAKGFALDPAALAPRFSPERFLIKLTPINPTTSAIDSGLESLIDPHDEEACRAVARRFTEIGYDTILSIGELRENHIGSNCGMFIAPATKHQQTITRAQPAAPLRRDKSTIVCRGGSGTAL
jgi:23S rRNA (adenine2503-C2)-methyltransferase